MCPCKLNIIPYYKMSHLTHSWLITDKGLYRQATTDKKMTLNLLIIIVYVVFTSASNSMLETKPWLVQLRTNNDKLTISDAVDIIKGIYKNESPHVMRFTGTLEKFQNISMKSVTQLSIQCRGDIEWKNITDTGFNLAIAFPALQRLTINCSMATVHYTLLRGTQTRGVQYLRELLILDLSGNNIHFIFSSAFMHMNKLMMLNLDNNPDLMPASQSLCWIPSIVSLSFIGSFKHWPHGVFSYGAEAGIPWNTVCGIIDRRMPHYLYLSNNNFSVIQDFSFTYMKSLKDQLVLSYSDIRKIDQYAFYGLKDLKHLVLTGNYIEDIDNGMFQHLTSLQWLLLNTNKLSVFSTNSIKFNKELLTLALDNNNIQYIQGSFHNFTKLWFINLSFNKLTKVSREWFAAAETGLNIKNISLKANPITQIEDGALDFLPNLQYLDLSHCKLKTLPIMGNLKSLIEIDLAYNWLQHMPKEGISYLTNSNVNALQKVDLSYNLLTSLGPHAFKGANNLKEIALAVNKIEYIHRSAFLTTENNSATCMNTIKIDLTSNSIRTFNTSSIVKCCRLKQLLLKFNQFLTNIQSTNQNITSLKSLSLQYCNLSKLTWNMVKNYPNLEDIYMHNNRIGYVEPAALKNLIHLSKITLNMNRLSNIDASSLQHVGMVQLHNNPWDCQCHLKSLVNYIRSNHPEGNITCYTPPNMASLALQSANITCEPSVKTYKLLVLPISLGLLLALCLLCIGLMFRYRYEIKIMWNIRHKVVYKTKSHTYHAFVSHSSSDLTFVRNSLMRSLEPDYKLYVYHRDSIPGSTIVEDIVQAINDSAVTIVILSMNFLNSEWTKLEFKQSYYKTMKSKSNNMIIILLEDIPIKHIEDPHIRAYIRTKTYIHRSDPQFHEKLISCMPKEDSSSTTSCDITQGQYGMNQNTISNTIADNTDIATSHSTSDTTMPDTSRSRIFSFKHLFSSKKDDKVKLINVKEKI